MGATFRSGHLLPPHNEYFSFAESITQRRTVKKMGWSDGYLAIAATALANNMILVTNNTDHFSRIDGMRLDNWTTLS
jgi:predicted nucleic acid-binding protein